MRILHLDSGREMRGGQWQVLRLIDGLRARGVDCTLLAPLGSPLRRAVAEHGCVVEVLTLGRLWREARRHDLVHAHDARSHTLAALVGGAPLVVARRVAFPVRRRWKYLRVAQVIAVSRFVAGLVEQAGVGKDRVNVVYDGVPLLAGVRARNGVVAPANLHDAAKGGAVAAKAAQLAGVELRFSDDLERDLLSAAVFVYATYTEGLGSAVLLAMSAGAAVVASNVGGLPEIVEHRQTGLLTENSPQAVGAAISELLDKPYLARQLAERARRRVEEEFTVERMIAGTSEVYRKVLEC